MNELLQISGSMQKALTKRAALYARVSTEEQAEEGYSIEAQLTALRSSAKSKDYHITEEYVDGGFTGRNDNRPAFKRMISDAQAGLFDIVLVHKFDRFSRKRDQAVAYKALLKKIGIPVISVLEPTDPDSPNSIILEGMLEVIAEWYSANLAQEVRKGKRQAAQQGNWQGGWLKYGYTVIKKKVESAAGKPNEISIYALDESEAKVILGLFQWIDVGKKAADWCRWANKQGIPTKRKSKGWTPQEVSELLRDKIYTGKGAYGKLTRKGNKLVPSNNPVPMNYPRIIDDDLFLRVQDKLRENKRKNKGSTKQERIYILQHLGRCGVCGGRLCCTTNGYGYKYIYCLNQSRFPHIYQCFKPKNWHLGMIEDSVWEEIDGILYNYRNQSFDSLIERYEKASGDREQQLARAESEVDRCNKERQRVLIMVRKGYVTQADAEIQFIEINKDQQHWQQEVANLKALQNNNSAVWEAFQNQYKKLDMFYTFFATPEWQKQVLNTLLQEFVLYRDGKVELRLKVPVNEKQVAETIVTLSSNDTTLGNFNYESMRSIDNT